MKIFLTGASGFIGRAVAKALAEGGHEVVALSRSGDAIEGVKVVRADLLYKGDWTALLADGDACVNLAGEPVDERWDIPKKRRMRDSRILATRNIVSSIPKGRKFTLISGSAVGYYGDGGERWLKEETPAGDDFMATLAKDWEAEALKGGERGARVVTMRMGVVLGAGGGILPKLKTQAHSPVRVPEGKGGSWVSWIHINDLVKAVKYFLEDESTKGPYNVSSPNPVRQREFTEALEPLLGPKARLRPPSPAIRIVVGEMADLALLSQRMTPEKLLKESFEFEHSEISEALGNILT